MKRAITCLVAVSFLASATLFVRSSSGTTCGDNTGSPPFMATGVKPNVLIILDNSGSMVQDFYGAAAGGWSTDSKTVIAQNELRTIVDELKTKARVGLMTFDLPSVSANNMDNSYYFVSYDDNSYCPNPSDETADACQAYCLNPSDSASKQKCYDGCRAGNSNFTTDFTDSILGTGASSTTRATYCPLIYPKTLTKTLKNRTFYYKKGPYQKYGYDTSSGFLWAGNYSTGNVLQSDYWAYSYKTDSLDTFSGYDTYRRTYNDNNYVTQLTETDTAMGFRDFGKRMVYWYIGPTWSGGVGPSPYGFLHISVNDLVDSNSIQTTTYSSLISYLTPKTDSSTNSTTGYMGCTETSKDKCSYIVSAGGTPTYGALNAALKYFGGTYDAPSGAPSDAETSPIAQRCQKNFIILVTDGLPSVDKSGNSNLNTASNTDEIVDLLSTSYCYDSSGGSFSTYSCNPDNGNADCLTRGKYTACLPKNSTVIKDFSDPNDHNKSKPYAFPIKTFVLGLGLLDTAKQNLNDMAKAGGTGQAYFADDPSQLSEKLETIITSILGQSASGTAVSILADQTQMGANMAQAIFYPSKYFGTTELVWPGYLYDYWFYIGSSPGLCSNGTAYNSQICKKNSDCTDTSFPTCDTDISGICYDSSQTHNTNQKCSSDSQCTQAGYPKCITSGKAFVNNIREDTVHDYVLNLVDDYGLTFMFDDINGLRVNRSSDLTASGSPNTSVDTVDMDHINPIWEAGKLLFQTPASARTIYSVKSSGSYGGDLIPFNSDIADPSKTDPYTLAALLGSPNSFDACLQVTGTDPDGLSDQSTRSNLINYVRGVDTYYCYNPNAGTYNSTACNPNNGNDDCKSSGSYSVCKTKCKNRTVGLCYNGTDYNNQGCDKNSDCRTGSFTTCKKNVWKLGDIIYSTPRVQSNYSYCASASSYCYNSTTGAYDVNQPCNPSNGNNECSTDSYPICRTRSTTYGSTLCSSNTDCAGDTAHPTCLPKESVIYVGANDGMLHAFKTGIESDQGIDISKHEVERLTGIPTSEMGKELWGFIPKNSLPYLRCLATGGPSSTCHLYYSDLSPYIADMAVNGQVRKVLIGGMRLGGATWYKDTSNKYCLNASGMSDGTTCSSTSTCPTGYKSSCGYAYHTTAPADTCSPVSRTTLASDASGCTGLSSYYALDITDPENPQFLWEFSHPKLGYAFSGPAVVHRVDSSGNGGYYVMFLSGPNVPGNGATTTGQSTQNLVAFVLTLDSNLAVSNVYVRDYSAIGNTAKNGFGGRLFTNGLDVSSPADGNTDFVFFGYGYSNNGTPDDWAGGIAKIYTGSIDPAGWDWDLSNYFNISQSPVTAKVEAMKCFDGQSAGGWWIYTGSGRYFYHDDTYGPGGNSGNDFLLGAQFTCDDQNACKQNVNYNHSGADVCNALSNPSATKAVGWTIDLNLAEDGYLKERDITDPSTTANNIIYFTTTEPTGDPCGYGGRTRVWGMNCATTEAISNQTCGATYKVSDTAAVLYLQTSTGAIQKVDPNTSLTGTGGKTSDWTPGIPPQEASQPINPTKPGSGSTRLGQVIQWMER